MSKLVACSFVNQQGGYRRDYMEAVGCVPPYMDLISQKPINYDLGQLR